MYDENDGNELANGAGNRFEGMDELFKAGGSPRAFAPGKLAGVLSAQKVIDAFIAGRSDTYAAVPTTTELAREFKAIKDFKEACDLITKEADRLYDYMRLALIPERFEAEGVSNIKVQGVGRVQLASDLYAGIKDKAAAFQWLDDNGRGALIQKSVNASSLKAVLKKMLVDGEEIPENLFKAEPFTRASIVKV